MSDAGQRYWFGVGQVLWTAGLVVAALHDALSMQWAGAAVAIVGAGLCGWFSGMAQNR